MENERGKSRNDRGETSQGIAFLVVLFVMFGLFWSLAGTPEITKITYAQWAAEHEIESTADFLLYAIAQAIAWVVALWVFLGVVTLLSIFKDLFLNRPADAEPSGSPGQKEASAQVSTPGLMNRLGRWFCVFLMWPVLFRSVLVKKQMEQRSD